MNQKLFLTTGAVLFFGGSAVALFQIISAFRKLNSLPDTSDPGYHSMAIGYVIFPIGVAVIGLIFGVVGIVLRLRRSSSKLNRPQ